MRKTRDNSKYVLFHYLLQVVNLQIQSLKRTEIGTKKSLNQKKVSLSFKF